jgi:hypothetical protein
MYQVFGVLTAIALGSELFNDNLVAIGVLAALSIVGLTRVNALYLGETFYYLAKHWLLDLLGEETVLDPDALYQSDRAEQQGSKFIVRGEDGSKMVVSTR